MDRVEVAKKRKRFFRTVLNAKRLKTMSALAELVNVTPSTLANIQSAKRSAGLDLVEKMKRLCPEVAGFEIFPRRRSKL